MGENGSAAVKGVVIGDGMVGKTCLLRRYFSNRFSEDYEASTFDHYKKDFKINGRNVEATLWDMAGQEDYEQYRSLIYPNTDIFLLCFSLADRTTLDNVLAKWIPEICQFYSEAPIILVGTKSDLKNDLNSFGIQNNKITTNDAEGVRKKINKRFEVNCFMYLECSAKLEKGVDKVFSEAIRNGLEPPMKQRMRSTRCPVL